MKKVLFALMLLISINSKAQITLDFTVDSTWYGYLFYATKISDNETKYVFLDTTSNTFSLYNLDMSPFMTNISVPSPLFFNGWFHIMYITRSLFDCDTSNIEYLYASQNSGANPLRVMRTDGTVLLQVDTAVGPYCLGCPGGTTLLRPILTTESGTKLLTMWAGGSSTGHRPVSVYSLCGNLPLNSEMYEFPDDEMADYIQIFPNPSSMQLNFKINLPDNIYSYELILLNSNSQEVHRKKLGTSESNFSIDVRNFSSGTYYYSLASKNRILKTGKFILNK
jgi:hypothetical protein